MEIRFAWDVVVEAAKAAFSDLGTNALDWVIGLGTPVLLTLMKARQAPKNRRWNYVRRNWRSEIRQLLVVSIVVWSAVFVYEAKWHIPRRILQEAENAPSPALLPSQIPVPPVAPPPATSVQKTFKTSQKRPGPPLRVDSVKVGGDAPGNAVEIVANLTNLSRKSLEFKDGGLQVFLPAPKTPQAREELEDELWARALTTLDTAVDHQLPTMEGGMFNLKRYSIQLSRSQTQAVIEGAANVYFLEVLQTHDSTRPLLELCGFVGKGRASFSYCYHHNKP